MSAFENCFDKHSFTELNNLDVSMFHVALKFCIRNCNINANGHFFDIGSNAGMIFDGAAKMLSSNKIKSGIFEIGQTLYDANTSEAEIISLLEQYGYQINKSVDARNYVFYLPR